MNAVLAHAGAFGHPFWHVAPVFLAPVVIIVGLTRHDRRQERTLVEEPQEIC